MRLIEVITLTKIPIQRPQILSYFSAGDIALGALVLVPLGKRYEKAIVIESHEISDFKIEIKKAGYELKPIKKIISQEPILTHQQIELALWLGQYYFCSSGLFLKMAMPKKLVVNSKSHTKKIREQKLIIASTISLAKKIQKSYKDSLLYHSELTKKQLNEAWWATKLNKNLTIVGTRSAIFLPFQGLNEIIIEDTTNPAHRSWDMFPHYQTKIVAKKLSNIFNAKLNIKSGDIPSLDNPYEVQLRKGYRIATADMRQELKDNNFSIFSRPLQKAITNALAQKKQIILFINRRGAANFILCRDCGYVAKCQNCETPLAYHLINAKPILLCHRCGHKELPPNLCPACQSHRIKTVGAGTQKVEMEVKKLFPAAKMLRLDSDTASLTKDQQKIIDAFIKKEVDILITTQIIFSWNNEIIKARPEILALISADTLLNLPDFQSGERTFQTIASLKNLLVTKNSFFIIQTYNPQSSIIQNAAQNNWQSFAAEEMGTRQLLGYPPFSQIVKLILRNKDPQKAATEAKILAVKLKHANKNTDTEISEALPAFIPKEKGKFIWNIIIKFKISKPEIKMSSEFLQRRNSLLQYVPSGWKIDVDPGDLL